MERECFTMWNVKLACFERCLRAVHSHRLCDLEDLFLRMVGLSSRSEQQHVGGPQLDYV